MQGAASQAPDRGQSARLMSCSGPRSLLSPTSSDAAPTVCWPLLWVQEPRAVSKTGGPCPRGADSMDQQPHEQEDVREVSAGREVGSTAIEPEGGAPRQLIREAVGGWDPEGRGAPRKAWGGGSWQYLCERPLRLELGVGAWSRSDGSQTSRGGCRTCRV